MRLLVQTGQVHRAFLLRARLRTFRALNAMICAVSCRVCTIMAMRCFARYVAVRHSGDRIDARSSHRKNDWIAHKFPPRYLTLALTRRHSAFACACVCMGACGRSIFQRPDIGCCGDCEELLGGYGGARGSKHLGLQGPPICVWHRKVSDVASLAAWYR